MKVYLSNSVINYVGSNWNNEAVTIQVQSMWLGTEPDFGPKTSKLNISLSNSITFINIIISYLQMQLIQDPPTYINEHQFHCWWFFKILF